MPLPAARGSLGERQAEVAVDQIGLSPGEAYALRTDQPPSTMGALFDAMGNIGVRTNNPRSRVDANGGAGAAGILAAGGVATGGARLLRFTALLNWDLLQHVSGVGWLYHLTASC